MTPEQEKAVALVRSRIRHLREPSRSDVEVRAALRIEGWAEGAIIEAFCLEGGAS